ncbi:putative glycolipid-binding domain-containing protein [Paenibacillus spiritus]|uniref:Putative glycolipid-binding domain-containing protein n=1 Tax=Paenibacillus spiritus TaxID=2496557 RepID=A0A5J5GE62_9BACL|nr:putative glycolipid-binding domain-containing protein [Paenibacillus spiritus]KAA9006367.1 putative glycolipid-binding domain-containing protein [Paenibacillus spiritus]
MKRTAVWENNRTYGSELLEVTLSGTSLRAQSTLITLEDAVPLKIEYQLEAADGWMKRVHLEIPALNRSLYLESTPDHRWLDSDGEEALELAGAIEVDISCTPFTNSLPIRRIEWRLNRPEVCQMVYIKVPELTLHKVEQVYTLIEENNDCRSFEYSSPTYRATLEVDSDGLVKDYPGLFTRKY